MERPPRIHQLTRELHASHTPTLVFRLPAQVLLPPVSHQWDVFQGQPATFSSLCGPEFWLESKQQEKITIIVKRHSDTACNLRKLEKLRQEDLKCFLMIISITIILCA